MTGVNGITTSRQAGDGTTSVVVIANEFMKEAKHFVEEGVHPQLIIKAYREAATLVSSNLTSIKLLEH
jgi:T-complex protein 1 subunit eta